MAARAAARSSTTQTPRIYVASLSDYNAGRLVGAWVAAVDADEVHEAIAKMLKSSREPFPEEVALHDHEGFGSYEVHEYDSIPLVCAIGAAIAEHGPVFADYLGHVGPPSDADHVARLVERFAESYQGEWDSLSTWAESFLEDTGALKDVPESLRNYIDFDQWADDAEVNGDILAIEAGGNVHVFWAR
jgi:antirestriction protein